MHLLHEDWLGIAKRLSLNTTARVIHGREHRANLVIGNAPDRWWAYCQACKCGGVELKTHVQFNTEHREYSGRQLITPTDLVPLQEADTHTQTAVVEFLYSKGMDVLYLPPLFTSARAGRLLMKSNGAWLGRALSEHIPEKWLMYTNIPYAGVIHSHKTAVITEDAFSMFKVRYAMERADTPVDVLCSLGTAVRDGLSVPLLQYDRVLFMYDGDSAGYVGAARESKRFGTFGLYSRSICAPHGLDPKDMTLQAIVDHLKGELALTS